MKWHTFDTRILRIDSQSEFSKTCNIQNTLPKTVIVRHHNSKKKFSVVDRFDLQVINNKIKIDVTNHYYPGHEWIEVTHWIEFNAPDDEN